MQSIARGLFQLSRRDREFLPFSLMLRDEIENFCLSVSFFETRMRISVFTLVLRDENENNVEKNVLLLGDGFPYFYVWGGVGWKWKWLLEGWSKFWFRLLRFPAKPFKPVYIYRHIKVFKHPPHNQNLNLFQIICILNRKKAEEIYLSSFGEIYFKLFEKSIWIRDQISCCLDVGQAGAMQGGGWGNEKEGDQHGDGGGQLGAGGQQPGGGLGQLGGGILQCPCSSGKLSQS